MPCFIKKNNYRERNKKTIGFRNKSLNFGFINSTSPLQQG